MSFILIWYFNYYYMCQIAILYPINLYKYDMPIKTNRHINVKGQINGGLPYP